MRISSSALLGLLSVTYVLLKFFAFLAQSNIKTSRVCDGQPAIDMLESVLSFTVWNCVTSSLVTICIMIYYISRPDTHRNRAWCRDEDGVEMVTHEEHDRSARFYEVRAPTRPDVARRRPTAAALLAPRCTCRCWSPWPAPWCSSSTWRAARESSRCT